LDFSSKIINSISYVAHSFKCSNEKKVLNKTEKVKTWNEYKNKNYYVMKIFMTLEKYPLSYTATAMPFKKKKCTIFCHL